MVRTKNMRKFGGKNTPKNKKLKRKTRKAKGHRYITRSKVTEYKRKQSMKKKVTIGVTGGVLVTIAALLAANSGNNNVVPNNDIVTAQQMLSTNINELRGKELTRQQKTHVKNAADILADTPSNIGNEILHPQGRYSDDPFFKREQRKKRIETRKKEAEQYKKDVEKWRRRREKGKPLRDKDERPMPLDYN